MNNNSYFLAFCNKYGFSPCYKNKTEETLLKKIRKSDFMIADDKCTHRMVGIYYREGSKQDPIVTVVCSRKEMPLARKIAFENGKKIYYDSDASALLFRNYYDGKVIQPDDFYSIVGYYANFLYHYDLPQKRKFGE